MEQEQQKKRNLKNPQNKGIKDFAKYSGIAFQMVGIILLTTWGGVKLDEVLDLKTPVFTIILSLLGVFAALYAVLREFIK
jgi:F0F1-type ATP synthase assembly protein I